MNEISNNRMVIKHRLAKLLLKEGYRIIDLKPKLNKDGTYDKTRVVYIFEYKDGLDQAIERLKKE